MNQENQDSLNEAIEILDGIIQDEGIPKKVIVKIKSIISTLKSEGETRLNVTKCLDTIEHMSEDINLQTFIRTQLWNVSSLLEKMNI